MPDLIPHHEPRLIETKDGWTVWSYRGATVRSSGIHNRLIMPGCPMDGTMHGFPEGHFRIIDCWLDHGDLPAPYVWKDKPGR
jgi:hypothetical protein